MNIKFLLNKDNKNYPKEISQTKISLNEENLVLNATDLILVQIDDILINLKKSKAVDTIT